MNQWTRIQQIRIQIQAGQQFHEGGGGGGIKYEELFGGLEANRLSERELGESQDYLDTVPKKASGRLRLRKEANRKTRLSI
jgi:hypothetical protein